MLYDTIIQTDEWKIPSFENKETAWGIQSQGTARQQTLTSA